jgi:tetratricopeptide (TPR) repeat protein
MNRYGQSRPKEGSIYKRSDTKTPRPTSTPNAGSYYGKSEDYRDAEHWVMAIDEYTMAIQLDPDYDLAYANRGYSYEELGQYQNAISDYTKSIQLDPDYAGTYNNRGYSYANLGQDQTGVDPIQWTPEYLG